MLCILALTYTVDVKLPNVDPGRVVVVFAIARGLEKFALADFSHRTTVPTLFIIVRFGAVSPEHTAVAPVIVPATGKSSIITIAVPVCLIPYASVTVTVYVYVPGAMLLGTFRVLPVPDKPLPDHEYVKGPLQPVTLAVNVVAIF